MLKSNDYFGTCFVMEDYVSQTLAIIRKAKYYTYLPWQTRSSLRGEVNGILFALFFPEVAVFNICS